MTDPINEATDRLYELSKDNILYDIADTLRIIGDSRMGVTQPRNEETRDFARKYYGF